MPKYHSSAVAELLPKRTLDYLEHGAPEGSRNAELFDATCQFRDAGQSVADAESRLLARAIADGLSETEARQTIRSAFSGAAREPLATKPEGHNAHQSSNHGTALPEPIDGGIVRILSDCFHPDEFVSIAPARETDEDEIVPSGGVTLTAAGWIARIEAKGGIEKVFGTKLGLFMRINPMIKDGTKNADVTRFRHALVEFDCDKTGNPIPKEEQYRRIIESGFPVAVLIDSGNKSLHAWIRVDAPNDDEYKRRVAIIWKHFEAMDLDKQNRNPSRLSRCPDGRRTVDGEVRHQRLLATRFGAESWDAWEAGNSGVDEPPFIDLRPFIENGCEPERPAVADVGLSACMLYAGRINEIHGEPGTGKSNVAIALCISVMKAGGTVLYIDPEDTPAGFTRRNLQFGADPDDLIHRCRYLHNPMPDEISSAQRWAVSCRPQLVVLDGLAESMAAEGLIEDKAGDVLSFFRARLRPFAEDAGSAVLVSDHVAKSAEERGRWARGSGAKLGRYDGVSYNISLVEAYSPGCAGAVRLTVAKDRNGGVGRVGDDIADVHFAPAGGNRTAVSFKKPEEESTVVRPIRTIFRIRQYLEKHEQADKRTLRTLGSAKTIDRTVDFMIAEGSLLLTVEGRKHVYTLPITGKYSIGKSEQTPDECVPCP